MITRQVLDQWCSQVMTPPKALRLCHETFGPMSPFLLQPSVLALADGLDSSNPSFTTLPKTEILAQRGSCLVLLENSNHCSLLREGIVLPLVWIPHCATSEDLPTALQKLASSVAEQVTSHGTNASGWGLNFDRRFVPEGLTFGNDLFDTFDSAFVALAVGLFAAVQGFEPNIKAVGSAAWSDTFGISPVAGLVAKIMAAIDFHATDFFLPSWQIAEVLRVQPEIESWIKLHPLSSGTQPESLWSAMQPMIAEFACIPPSPVSSEDQNAFDVCVRYHQALPPRSDRQKKFYQSHLLNSIFSRCRRAIAKQYADPSRQKLVTIVSGEKEVTLITILSVGVKECLLLHTNDERQTELASYQGTHEGQNAPAKREAIDTP